MPVRESPNLPDVSLLLGSRFLSMNERFEINFLEGFQAQCFQEREFIVI